jgi:hypothetical protein
LELLPDAGAPEAVGDSGDALSEVLQPIDVLAYSPEGFDASKAREASFLGHILKTAEPLVLAPDA